VALVIIVAALCKMLKTLLPVVPACSIALTAAVCCCCCLLLLLLLLAVGHMPVWGGTMCMYSW
jgi:hypothetical protein